MGVRYACDAARARPGAHGDWRRFDASFRLAYGVGESAVQLFRTEALRSQYRLHGDVSLVPPVSWQLLGIFLVLAVGAAILFLSVAGYARTSTVTGQLEGDRGVQRAVAPRDGVIAQLLVREGERVRAGQPLVRIDVSTRGEGAVLESERAAAIERQASALSRRAPGMAREAQARIEVLQAQVAADRAWLDQATRQIAEQHALIAAATQNLARARRVAERGFVSQEEVRRREETLSARRQALSRLEQDRSDRTARIASAGAEMERQRAELQVALADLERARGEVAGAAAGETSQRALTLTAATDGVVTGLSVHAGDTVAAGGTMLSIVPGGTRLVARLAVPPSAAGFIAPGQPVRIAVDAFPRQVYGTLPARVTNVTAATIPVTQGGRTAEAFLVDAAIDAQSITAYGRGVPLRPGMTIAAQITTRRQSLLQWLLDPLYAVRGE
jgi:membrane fusion protein